MVIKAPVLPDSKTQTQNSGHGGNIYKAALESGISEEKIVDFSASINPLGVSAKVKEVILQELDPLVNYPDPDTKELRHKISRHLGLDPGNILCGNGSTELIYLIPRALKPKSVLITAPAFSEYERACSLNYESRIMMYELKEKNNFRINADEFISAMTGEMNSTLHCDMAFLCNPNNPTGSLLKREAVLKIAEAARESKCFLVVDEAFIDFTPEESVIADVRDNPYLIVLRSMTKFYALTGLRIGYGVFHKDLIERIKEFKEPWTVNNLAQKAASAALEDSVYAEKTFSLINKEKAFLEKRFRETEIKYFPSAANYYLLKIENAGDVVSSLRKKGMLVRDCSNYKGLGSSYIRVAVKSHKHNEALLEELLKLCGA